MSINDIIEKDSDDRIKKQFGDFCEHLIMYLLGIKGVSVAHIDHVGADLLATKNNNKYAISVKGRRFITDSLTYTFKHNDIKHLEGFTNQWTLFTPTVAFVLIDYHEQPRKIRVPIMTLETMKNKAADPEVSYITQAKNGYSIRISRKKYIEQMKQDTDIDYIELEFSEFNSSWSL